MAVSALALHFAPSAPFVLPVFLVCFPYFISFGFY
jgi:hypothetical protein